MKSKRVTCTWEFYRDNCDGFKEPMRKELRKLDGYVSNLEAENAELREQIQDAEHEESIAWDRVRSAERRNAELCKLLVDFRDAMWGGGEWTEPFDERMRELGVEV